MKQRQTISFSMSKFRFFQPLSSFQRSHGALIRGFNIVKAFIELGTYNTIESLQALCANRVQAQSSPQLTSVSFQYKHARSSPSMGGRGPNHDTHSNLQRGGRRINRLVRSGRSKVCRWRSQMVASQGTRRGRRGVDNRTRILGGPEWRSSSGKKASVGRRDRVEDGASGNRHGQDSPCYQLLLLTTTDSSTSMGVCSQTFPSYTVVDSNTSKARTFGVQ